MNCVQSLCFIIAFFLSNQVFSQSFIPNSPDTTRIKQIWNQQKYYETIGYTYLIENYASKTSKVIINKSDVGEANPCSFSQRFELGIYYEIDRCYYSVMSEKIIFPKMETKVARDLISELFYESWNIWESEFIYSPIGGAGCYYEIQQSEDHTTISIGCGC